MNSNKRPCLIVSSARSGSKLLRELLMQSGEFNCYPYDINYVWMKGFADRMDDELTVGEFKPKNADYIVGYLSKLVKSGSKGRRILEKTVSNSLRLDYVLKVVPNAQVIHLIRDGRDATASIKSCWIEPAYSKKNQDGSLLVRKLLNFPYLSSAPYLWRYIRNSVPMLMGDESLKSWGPRFSGIDEMLEKKSLAAVCATQWLRSIQLSHEVLRNRVECDTYIEVRYEDLMDFPEATIHRIAAFLHIHSAGKRMISWGANNFRKNQSDWESKLTVEEKEVILSIIEPELRRLGYLAE